MSVFKRPGAKYYEFDFQIQRVRFCGSTGCTSERAAKDFERTRKIEERQKLAAIKESRTGPMTINVAFDRFWSEVGDRYTGTYRTTVWTALAWMMEEFGKATLIRDIGPNRITEAIARRRGQVASNATINRTVTELLRRIMIRAARQWEQDVKPIEWKKLLLPEPKERVRELRTEEESKVMAAMREDYRPALAFMLVSGFRLRETVNLRWSDIDWTSGTIAVTGKGDKPATIPLTMEMRAILSPLRDHHPEFVFTYAARRTRTVQKAGRKVMRGIRYPITYSGLKTVWRRYGGSEAGLSDFRLHDTRHTAATRLLRESGNLKLVQKLLRHDDISTTVKYAHADDSDLRAAMEAVSESRRKVPLQADQRKASGDED